MRTPRALLIARAAILIALVAATGALAGETPTFYGDGQHDDAPALRAAVAGERISIAASNARVWASAGYVEVRDAQVVLCSPVDFEGRGAIYLSVVLIGAAAKDSRSFPSNEHYLDGVELADFDRFVAHAFRAMDHVLPATICAPTS